MPPSLVARAVEWIRAADESLDDGANISSPVLGRRATAALLRDLEAELAKRTVTEDPSVTDPETIL